MGKGIYCKKAIKKGTFITEITGEVFDKVDEIYQNR